MSSKHRYRRIFFYKIDIDELLEINLLEMQRKLSYKLWLWNKTPFK